MLTDHDLVEMEMTFIPEAKHNAMGGMGVKLIAEVRALRKEVRDAKVVGIKLAAEVAGDYNHTSSHPYLISECILAKLNVMKRHPRKNPAAKKINEALTRLEHKVASVEGTMRFMTGLSKFTAKKTKKK